MIVVSGCPRSGTSLMMDALRASLGESRIIGSKFPAPDRIEKMMEKVPDRLRDIQTYLFAKQHPKWDQEQAESRDMNPNGFWECAWSVRGIGYSLALADQLDKVEHEAKDRLSICKIVSQGLAQSDPRYVDRVIFMLRHPRQVAKSQERLKRRAPLPLDDFKIHTPEMFIHVNVAVSRWLKRYGDIPVLIVEFDDLVGDPEATIKRIADFVGEGDWRAGASCIEPKLKRSDPEPVENPLWEDAEAVYGLIRAGDWAGVIDYFDRQERETHRQQRHWHCSRAGQVVNAVECERCRSDAVVRGNFKARAERQGVDWRKEPCAYECGFDMTRSEPLTIAQSIESNFWVEEGPPALVEGQTTEEEKRPRRFGWFTSAIFGRRRGTAVEGRPVREV